MTPAVAETWANFCSAHWFLISVVVAFSAYTFLLFGVFALAMLEMIVGKK